MSYGHDSGSGLKGLMMLAMLFVFGGAAYLAARDFENELGGQFFTNTNVIRRIGDVKECGIAIRPSIDKKQSGLRVGGGAGTAQVSIGREESRIKRAYLTTRERPEPGPVLGADPMVPSSYIMTR